MSVGHGFLALWLPVAALFGVVGTWSGLAMMAGKLDDPAPGEGVPAA